MGNDSCAGSVSALKTINALTLVWRVKHFILPAFQKTLLTSSWIVYYSPLILETLPFWYARFFAFTASASDYSLGKARNPKTIAWGSLWIIRRKTSKYIERGSFEVLSGSDSWSRKWNIFQLILEAGLRNNQEIEFYGQVAVHVGICQDISDLPTGSIDCCWLYSQWNKTTIFWKQTSYARQEKLNLNTLWSVEWSVPVGNCVSCLNLGQWISAGQRLICVKDKVSQDQIVPRTYNIGNCVWQPFSPGACQDDTKGSLSFRWANREVYIGALLRTDLKRRYSFCKNYIESMSTTVQKEGCKLKVRHSKFLIREPIAVDSSDWG